MRQRSIVRLLFLVILCSATYNLQAEDLEHLTTTTAVYNGGPGLSGGSAYTMPAGTNSYVGWVWFPFGFTMGSGVESSLNVIPTIDGTITLNDGTLTMTGDVRLASNGAISGDGTISGMGNALILHDQLELNSTITFATDTIIDGNNNAIILGDNAQLWISSGITVTFQNLILKNLNDTAPTSSKLVMAGTGSILALDNVTIWLDGDYSFTQGSMYIHNDVTIAGSTHTFHYQSAQKSYITDQSLLKIDHGVRFYYNPMASLPETRTRLEMFDDTSHLYLNGCKFHTDEAGLELTKGTVVFDSLVTLSADGQVVANAMTFGSASQDLTSIVLPGANLEVYGYIDVT